MNDKENKNEQYGYLTIENVAYKTILPKKYLARKPYKEIDANRVNAFISGEIADVFVKKGQHVRAGEPLLILEAMKMRNEITAHVDATVKNVYVAKGDLVTKDQLLLEFK